jgi:DNA-binding MarR family transcriptional regulator
MIRTASEHRARVADRLHSTAIHLLRRARREDEATGLGPARLSALSVVVFAGPLGLGRLAAAEQVTAPTMSRIVVGLERDGLVRRDPDPADGRGVIISATSKGNRLLQRARKRRIENLAALMEPLAPGDVAVLERAATILEGVLATGALVDSSGPAA